MSADLPAWLSDLGQEHVARRAAALDPAARERLSAQLSSLDPSALRLQREVLATARRAASPRSPEPPVVLSPEGEERARLAQAGARTIAEGRVGVLIVAGGQGSRFGYDGPKGCFPVSPLRGLSFFELHARKVRALRERTGAAVPLYVMTGPTNDAATRAFFAEKSYFGLPSADVRFVPQASWPALDDEGRMLFDAPDHLFVSPDGHGGLLSALRATGALEDMEARGLSCLSYFQVDNALVQVADPLFVGLHEREGADVSLKTFRRNSPTEATGTIVSFDGRPGVLEYSDPSFTDEMKSARLPDGSLRFAWGNAAMHLFSIPFLRRVAEAGLPVHLAHKKVPYCDETGASVKPEAPNAWKFEKFVFDAFPMARRSVCLAIDRAQEYAPLKEATGPRGPEAVHRALSDRAAGWLESCGVAVPRDADGHSRFPIEIDPLYADGPDALRARVASRPPVIDGPTVLSAES